MRILLSGALIITGLLATTYSASAQDSFTRQGYTYTCESQCEITYSGSGQFSVRDKFGGSVTKFKIDSVRQ
jgi:hypothetical protein